MTTANHLFQACHVRRGVAAGFEVNRQSEKVVNCAPILRRLILGLPLRSAEGRLQDNGYVVEHVS